MRRSAPLRFVALILALWIGGRAFYLLSRGRPFDETASASPSPPPASGVVVLPVATTALPARHDDTDLALILSSGSAHGVRIALAEASPSARVHVMLPAAQPAAARLALADPARSLPPEAPLLSVRLPPLAPAPRRWSGSAWAFVRGGEGARTVGPGGEIGGSQAGARVAYRLDGAGRVALFARGYAPLRRSGAEVSAGIEWHPVPRIPFRLAVERRQRVTQGGRSAWMASAIGGFYSEPPPGLLRIDGYAQAGIVGMRSRDLFADGSVRAGYPLPLGGGASVTLGGGVWGAAQPGAKRVDLGPQATLRYPVDGATLVMAADYRVRVAGHARPKSGPALTLGFDF